MGHASVENPSLTGYNNSRKLLLDNESYFAGVSVFAEFFRSVPAEQHGALVLLVHNQQAFLPIAVTSKRRRLASLRSYFPPQFYLHVFYSMAVK